MLRRDFNKLLSFSVLASSASRFSIAADQAQQVAKPDNWPCWRGPSRDGKTTSDVWPQELSEQSLKLRWEVSLEDSYSGPIVYGNQVIVTETRGKKMEAVHAFAVDSGEKQWSQEWLGEMTVPFFAKRNGDWIRSTPACDENNVYVAGMRDVLVCLNRNDGSEKWRFDFPAQFKTALPDFGFVCSPLVIGDRVYVQAGGAFVCLEGSTGKVVWRSLEDGGGMNGSAFSSPILQEIAGRKQILVQTRNDLCSVDPDSGSKIWSTKIEAFRGMNILTPTVWQDRIFTSSYGGKSWLFNLTPDSAGPWSVSQQWENKSQGYMSSPIVIDNHLYLHLRNQRFVCIDMTTGETAWTSRPFGEYWSMISNGKQILALDQKGVLYLIDADPKEFRIVSERKVTDNEAWAHIGFANKQIFIRHQKGLQVYNWS